MELCVTKCSAPMIVAREADEVGNVIDVVVDSADRAAVDPYVDPLGTIERSSGDVECGQVTIDTATSGRDAHMPFGGFRSSGRRVEEQGAATVGFRRKVDVGAIHMPVGAP